MESGHRSDSNSNYTVLGRGYDAFRVRRDDCVHEAALWHESSEEDPKTNLIDLARKMMYNYKPEILHDDGVDF